MLCIRIFPSSSVKLVMKELGDFVIFRYFDMFTDSEWVIQRSTNTAEESLYYYFSVCIWAVKSSSLVLQNIYICASPSTHSSLSVIQQELSKPRENMIRWIQSHLSVNGEKTCCLIRMQLEQRWPYLTPRFFPILNDDRTQEVSRTQATFCVHHLHNNSWPFADI